MTDARRVVIAPDSFKGSISARAAAEALAEGWRREAPGDDIVLRPLADGGEGTLEAFLAAVPGARRCGIRVTGADGELRDAAWVLLPPDSQTPGGTGVVELAVASGIEGLRGRLLPWDAGSDGFGEAIAAALGAGVSRLILGIGSSASTDGGAGVLRALGARLLDARGEPVRPGLRGLREVTSVDLTAIAAPPHGGAIVLSDVDNPLCGPRGAAAAFGPQKGLRHEEIAAADAALERWAGFFDARPDAASSGAAGGVGFALQVWGAQTMSGSAYVADLLGLPALLGPGVVVLTGEGSYDATSAGGKVPAEIARLARAAGAEVALVAGRIDDAAALGAFVVAVSLTELAGDAASALAEPSRYLAEAAARVARRVRAAA